MPGSHVGKQTFAASASSSPSPTRRANIGVLHEARPVDNTRIPLRTTEAWSCRQLTGSEIRALAQLLAVGCRRAAAAAATCVAKEPGPNKAAWGAGAWG